MHVKKTGMGIDNICRIIDMQKRYNKEVYIMKRYSKIIICLMILIMLSNLISCTNTSGQQSQPTSKNESLSSSQIQSQLSSESSKPNISGKGDLCTNKKLKVGLVGPGAAGEWNYTMEKNILNTAKEWNIDMEFVDGQCKQEVQIEHLEDLIEKEVDAIGFIPAVELGWEEVLTKVKQANIPIILIDRVVDCDDRSLWHSRIVNDFDKEGQMAGEWLIEYLEKQGKLDEEIKIAELNGTEGAEATKGRGQGFRDSIKNNINLEVVVSKCSDYTYSYAYENMANILSETTDIDVLFCHNDEMALGAIKAIEEAGLVPGEDIIIISIMGTNAALEAIVEGKIACSVECNPLMGDLFMEACVRLANGEEIEREIHPVDRVFDITNAQAELDAREENGYGY